MYYFKAELYFFIKVYFLLPNFITGIVIVITVG